MSRLENRFIPSTGNEEVHRLGYRRLAQNLAILLCCAVALSVAVGLRGIFATEGGLTAWLVPVVVAVVLGALLAGLWHMALDTAAAVDVQDPVRFWTVLGLGGGITAIAAMTSMPFLASAIGGAEAVRHHQERTIAVISFAAEDLGETVRRQQRLQDALDGERQGLTELLAREITGRGPSGQAGRGPVAEAISAAVQAFAGAGQSAQTSARAVDVQLQEVRAQLGAARAAAAAGNESAFVASIEAARAGVADIRGRLDHASLVLPDFSLSPLAELRAAGSRLNGTLSLLPGVAAMPLPAYEAMSRPRAVLTYPEAVPLAWSVAVALDVLPLVLLVMLVMTGRMSSGGLGIPELHATEVRLADHDPR